MAKFVKGVSGNPKGRPRKDAVEVVESQHIATRNDGWQSALTGLGIAGIDKRVGHQFRGTRLSYQDAIQMWLGDDLAARAIETVPRECFREGYDLVIADEGTYDDLKEDIEEEMERLEANKIITRAYCIERALGGSAILLGVNDGQKLETPMVQSNVSSLDWISVLEPLELTPYKFYTDPRSPKYGEPELYALSMTNQSEYSGTIDQRASAPPNQHYIHETRLIVFPGIRVSRYQATAGIAGALWGDSILTRIADVLRDFNIAWQSAGIIVTDFSQSIFSIENLTGLVAKNESGLRARMQALELGRSTARAVLIDTKEKFDRQSTSVAGLPDLMDRLSQRLASAIDMPLSLLMGQTPQGIGADGSSDVRFYYDRIVGLQEERIRPVLTKIIKILMGTLRKRKVPKKWHVRFEPMWQLTDAERAEARLTQARIDSLNIKSGIIHPDEIRSSRFKGEYSFETQIDESKKAPGFMAPLPKGVLPGSTPNVGSGQAGTAPGAPAAQGPNAHSVQGYARRNPGQGGEASPSESGERGDGKDASENLLDELLGTIDRYSRMIAESRAAEAQVQTQDVNSGDGGGTGVVEVDTETEE